MLINYQLTGIMSNLDNILSIIDKNSDKVLQNISSKVKARRLEKNLTQAGLAARAGVNYATYRRFEQQGEISLRNLVLIAMALGYVDDFDALFDAPTYQNIDELTQLNARPNRKRGTKK